MWLTKSFAHIVCPHRFSVVGHRGAMRWVKMGRLANRFSTRDRSMNLFACFQTVLILAVVCVIATTARPAAAELTAGQKKSVAEIAEQLREAGTLYQSGSFVESGKKIEAVMAAIDKLIAAGGPEAFDALSPAFPRIATAHALLELEGVSLAPLIKPERPEVAKPAAAPRSAPRNRRPMPEPAAPAGPSFASQIAPILVQRCGTCHINNSRGDFNMATFAMLAKGPPAGTVVFPGDVVASRLIESIETGDMPRGGGKVSPAELQLLKDWVLAGAKYDAPSPLIPLAALAANAPAGAAVPMAVPMAATPPQDPSLRAPTGNETVSFARDIAPILLANCGGCHVNAMQVRGGLRMDTFTALMRGGDSGEIVLPTRAAASLLVKKIKGEEGDRMPAGGRPPLTEAQITLISKWIEENATLDSPDKDQPLDVMASQAWAAAATPGELSERRVELARKNMTLIGSASSKVVEQSFEPFFVIGDVGEATAKAVVDAAKRALGKIKQTVDASAIRGNITIYVMPKRYNYSEFAQMAERRSLPSDWQSHWRYNGVDAYIAMIASSSDSDNLLEAKIAGPLASLAVATRGTDVPRWFAEGVGRAVTAKLYAREYPAVETWNSGVVPAAAAMKDGDQLVKNSLAPEQADLIGYGIAAAILKGQRRQYDTLLKNLEKGKFEQAFTAALGASPTAYADRWKSYPAAGLEGRKR